MFYVKDSAFFYKAHIVSATSSVSCDFFSCQISFILKNVFYIEILIRCIIKVFGTCCQRTGFYLNFGDDLDYSLFFT